jgi:hypothetical protein
VDGSEARLGAASSSVIHWSKNYAHPSPSYGAVADAMSEVARLYDKRADRIAWSDIVSALQHYMSQLVQGDQRRKVILDWLKDVEEHLHP